MAEAAKTVEICIMVGLLVKRLARLVIKKMRVETKVVLVCNW